MEKNTIDGFTYYSVEPKNQNESKKVILIYHGWGGSTSGYRDLAEEIAEEGFHVIIPEIVYHDTRQPLANPFEAKTIQTYFWETIMTTIDELPDFIKALGIIGENVVLIGSSMGGCIANGIFAREQEVGGLANINGSGSFVLSERMFRERDYREAMSGTVRKRLMEYDPVERPISPSLVLLMHGDCDEVMPIEGQRDYDHYLKKEQKKNAKFLVYEGVNHQITRDMVGDLIGWLKRV
ncbi:alpha/beta fold hydrolase [Bacillus sp. MCCB 382]|uniref:alpha/beta fold hydrolase n=1 Tax=Bacillus sp. MCCB 382 TaxID=2860197 RepID=UPI001C569F8C|nr:alpha/beta fold hydrolase [Bacillus sp. MCCB 382]